MVAATDTKPFSGGADAATASIEFLLPPAPPEATIGWITLFETLPSVCSQTALSPLGDPWKNSLQGNHLDAFTNGRKDDGLNRRTVQEEDTPSAAMLPQLSDEDEDEVVNIDSSPTAREVGVSLEMMRSPEMAENRRSEPSRLRRSGQEEDKEGSPTSYLGWLDNR